MKMKTQNEKITYADIANNNLLVNIAKQLQNIKDKEIIDIEKQGNLGLLMKSKTKIDNVLNIPFKSKDINPDDIKDLIFTKKD